MSEEIFHLKALTYHVKLMTGRIAQQVNRLKTGNKCHVCGVPLLERCNRELQKCVTKSFGGKSPFQIEHHVSYEPEKTIFVCVSCHNEIHDTDKHPELKPEKERPRTSKAIGSRRLTDFEG